MTFLTPLALALSVLAVPIVLMYVLKLRRRPQVVSSTLLWQRALDDVQANAPWQRLRPSILLLLQLLALVALVLALAQPAYTRAERFTGDLIVIVDESYGMQAHDVAPSRFAAALVQAHTLANDLPGGNVASVIGMGAQPQLAIAESSDSGAISRAIDQRLHVGASAPNLLGALSLAASLARSGQTTRAVILTSRESGILSGAGLSGVGSSGTGSSAGGLPLALPFPVEIVRIGGHLRDLGITAFSAAHDGGRTRALARIGNFGATTQGSDLNLYVDGQLADVRPLSVGPGKQQTLFWNNLPARTHTLHVQLTQADDVVLDKAAWAVTTVEGERRVLLVASHDYFVQTALSIDPAVQLSLLPPANYQPALAQQYDLVVFDGTLPATLPPVPVLLLSPPSGHLGSLRFGVSQPLSAGTAVSASTGATSSLLHYVDLSDVHVSRARVVSLPASMLPIASSNNTPLLAAGDINGRRIALATFNLADSDWPLRISFPIVIQNLLHYLAPSLGLAAANVAAGQPVQLFPPAGTREIDIHRPNGTVDRVAPPFAPFTATTQPGLYSARTIGGFRQSAVTFAVNFFPSRPAPAIGKAHIVLGQSHAGSSRSVIIPESIGWIFALVVLAFLTTEWWFAFRR